MISKSVPSSPSDRKQLANPLQVAGSAENLVGRVGAYLFFLTSYFWETVYTYVAFKFPLKF